MQNDYTVRFSVEGEHITTLPLCASDDTQALRVASRSRVGFDIEVWRGDRVLYRSTDEAVIEFLPGNRTT